MSEILDVVNDNDQVIGRAERYDVHRIGLVCRLVYVCFYTSKGEVILQKRSATKKNDAGKLTTTVSGHVTSGQDYEQAAIKESFEETGIKVDADRLKSIGIVRADYRQGEYISNAMRGLFAYQFDGRLEDLKIEAVDGGGFVKVPIDELARRLDSEPNAFATIMLDKVGRDLLQSIKTLI